MGPPAVRGGKVYAVALYLGDYAMVCLDAETGRLLWRTPILRGRNRLSIQIGRRSFLNTRQKDWAAPPVVRGDRVYMLASGAAGAFDAITGRPLWAYQYSRGRPSGRHGRVFNPASRRGKDPSNPPLVMGERLVIYPADGNGISALSAADGKLLWHRDDATRKYLVPAGDDRVILAGPDLLEVSVKSGKVTRKQEEVLVIGRPAVTEAELVVGGWGKLLRLSLDSWKIRTSEIPDRGMLGNTISAGGRLISVNAAGLSVYGDRETEPQPAEKETHGAQRDGVEDGDPATGGEKETEAAAEKSPEAAENSTGR
jgi:outer membrane protein assembly factor BamB